MSRYILGWPLCLQTVWSAGYEVTEKGAEKWDGLVKEKAALKLFSIATWSCHSFNVVSSLFLDLTREQELGPWPRGKPEKPSCFSGSDQKSGCDHKCCLYRLKYFYFHFHCLRLFTVCLNLKVAFSGHCGIQFVQILFMIMRFRFDQNK